MHRCRAWAYRWYKRYNENGLDGLKDKERSGRPPDVPKEVMIKIQKELVDNNTGWDFFRQVMNLIYKKTGIGYHDVHIYRLLHKWGFKPKIPQKRFVNTTASVQDKKKFKKTVKQILASLKSDWNVLVQDGSIFVHDYVIRRKKWISKNKRPLVTVTSSRKKTIVFGSLSLDGKQLFKQYDEFNSKTFVDYLNMYRKDLFALLRNYENR